MATELSPLTRRFAGRWHSEHAGEAPSDYWTVADGEGHHARKHFFTRAAADAYAVLQQVSLLLKEES